MQLYADFLPVYIRTNVKHSVMLDSCIMQIATSYADSYLQTICTLNPFDTFPYSFSATQVYSPLSVTSSAVKIRTLSLLVLGQDEQESGNDQLYTGSGDADTVQFRIRSSSKITVTSCFCSDINFGGPAHKKLSYNYICRCTWLSQLFVILH